MDHGPGMRLCHSDIGMPIPTLSKILVHLTPLELLCQSNVQTAAPVVACWRLCSIKIHGSFVKGQTPGQNFHPAEIPHFQNCSEEGQGVKLFFRYQNQIPAVRNLPKVGIKRKRRMETEFVNISRMARWVQSQPEEAAGEASQPNNPEQPPHVGLKGKNSPERGGWKDFFQQTWPVRAKRMPQFHWISIFWWKTGLFKKLQQALNTSASHISFAALAFLQQPLQRVLFCLYCIFHCIMLSETVF